MTHIFKVEPFSSLRPSDAMWRYRSESTLAQVNKLILLLEIQSHSPESNFMANAQATFLYNEFENYTFKITWTTELNWSIWKIFIFPDEELNIFVYGFKFHRVKVYSWDSNSQYVIIGSQNGLAPFRRQAITQTNGPVNWCIYLPQIFSLCLWKHSAKSL